jgi:hypothetical protein
MLMPSKANMAAMDAQLEGSLNRFKMLSIIGSFLKTLIKVFTTIHGTCFGKVIANLPLRT